MLTAFSRSAFLGTLTAAALEKRARHILFTGDFDLAARLIQAVQMRVQQLATYGLTLCLVLTVGLH